MPRSNNTSPPPLTIATFNHFLGSQPPPPSTTPHLTTPPTANPSPPSGQERKTCRYVRHIGHQNVVLRAPGARLRVDRGSRHHRQGPVEHVSCHRCTVGRARQQRNTSLPVCQIDGIRGTGVRGSLALPHFACQMRIAHVQRTTLVALPLLPILVRPSTMPFAARAHTSLTCKGTNVFTQKCALIITIVTTDHQPPTTKCQSPANHQPHQPPTTNNLPPLTTNCPPTTITTNHHQIRQRRVLLRDMSGPRTSVLPLASARRVRQNRGRQANPRQLLQAREAGWSCYQQRVARRPRDHGLRVSVPRSCPVG